MKKYRKIIGLVLLLALTTTACGGNTATDATGSGTNAASQNGSSTNTGEAVVQQASLEPYTPVDPDSVPANAESDFVYEVNENGTAHITGYVGTATQVRIPSTLGGSSEIRIDKEAFRQNESITYIYIPENVNYNDASFLACTALEEVYLAGSVSQIESGAFKECTALRRVEMGEGIQYLEGGLSTGVFSGCTSLTEVIFPSTLEMIGDCTFEDCVNLESVDLSFTKVYFIGQMAFSGCSRLSEISLPATLSGSDPGGLSSSAFLSCPSLKNVTIDPANTELTLENGILYSDDELICRIEGMGEEDAVVRDGTKMIRYSAFSYQENLRSVTFPDSLKEIDRNAFKSCKNLETIQFGSGIEKIGQSAFYECQALEEVVLPDSVTSLSDSAFAYCYGLKKVVLPDNIKMFGSIEDYIFSLCTDAVFTYKGKEYTYEQAADLTAAIDAE